MLSATSDFSSIMSPQISDPYPKTALELWGSRLELLSPNTPVDMDIPLDTHFTNVASDKSDQKSPYLTYNAQSFNSGRLNIGDEPIEIYELVDSYEPVEKYELVETYVPVERYEEPIDKYTEPVQDESELDYAPTHEPFPFPSQKAFDLALGAIKALKEQLVLQETLWDDLARDFTNQLNILPVTTLELVIGTRRLFAGEIEDIDNDTEGALQHKPKISFSSLTASLNLTASHLNVNKFELRLLSFFHQYCIRLFTFDVNLVAKSIWENRVPSLFLRSHLVRQSMFSFAALNLLPLCDLNNLHVVDSGQYTSVVPEENSTGVIFNHHKSALENLEEMYLKTQNYFLEVVLQQQKIFGVPGDNSTLYKRITKSNAAELVVSSVLMYSYLCMNPNRVTPLLSLDKSEADILSITRGIKATMTQCSYVLKDTRLGGFFSLLDELRAPVSLRTTTIPIMSTVYKEFREYFKMDEGGHILELRDLYALESSLITFHRLMYRCIVDNYPVPLFKWLIQTPDELADLIYKHQFFAIRILYIYASVVAMLRFQLYQDRTVWLDFMDWYKDYCEKLGGWKHPIDAAFYNLARKRLVKFKFPGVMQVFDPLNVDEGLLCPY